MNALRINNLGKTNLIFSIIGIVGYITIYFGIFPHISLGLFQVALFFYLIVKRRKLVVPLKEHFTIYAALVVTDLSMLFLNDSLYALWAWGASFAIAFYFTYIMYQLKKINHENN